MTSTLFETTIGAFEERMALRRKMLGVTGVKFPKRLTQELQDEVRESILACYACKSGETCANWLAKTADGVSPPAFCPNHDAILRLKAGGHAKRAGK
jgi:hypothetical protein